MKMMDQNLLNANKYGYSSSNNVHGWIGYPYINVVANQGLFYVSTYDNEQLQYKKTIQVITSLYMARSKVYEKVQTVLDIFYI
jgi:hypothetical protein